MRKKTDVRQKVLKNRDGAAFVGAAKKAKSVPKSNTNSTVAKIVEYVKQNPNVTVQVLSFLMILANNEKNKLGSRMENVANAVDKMKNVADVVNNTMTSIRTATEAPAKIKRLLE